MQYLCFQQSLFCLGARLTKSPVLIHHSKRENNCSFHKINIIYCILCELTYAGCRNKCKTTDEMQDKLVFLTSWTRGSLKQHLGRSTQTGMQALQSSVTWACLQSSSPNVHYVSVYTNINTKALVNLLKSEYKSTWTSCFICLRILYNF